MKKILFTVLMCMFIFTFSCDDNIPNIPNKPIEIPENDPSFEEQHPEIEGIYESENIHIELMYESNASRFLCLIKPVWDIWRNLGNGKFTYSERTGTIKFYSWTNELKLALYKTGRVIDNNKIVIDNETLTRKSN